MPQVFNGIGTWYWGQRNIRTRRGRCEHCGGLSDLRSYDSTLFFVVFFLPILPLKRVRVTNQCAACKRHRVANLKEWNTARDNTVGPALAACRQHPSDPALAENAIGAAVAFQDEPAFLDVASLVSEPLGQNAAMQHLLGSAHAFFGHKDLAEISYRTSLDIKEDPEVSLTLGAHLLRTGQPQEGWELVRAQLAPGDSEKAGYAYLAAASFQSQGLHAEALEVIDHAASLDPHIAKDKDFKRLRRASQKRLHTNKKVPSPLMESGGGKAPRERPLLARIPLVIPVLLLLGAIAIYLSVAFYRGKHQTVFLVSGMHSAVTGTLGNKSFKLAASGHTRVQVPQGDLLLSINTPGAAIPPRTLSIRTPFWTRPFTHATIVVNPDQLALIQWEETTYVPQGQTAPAGSVRFHAGEPLYTFTDIDYEFQDFPSQLSVSRKSGQLRKHRVGSLSNLRIDETLRIIAGEVGESAAMHWVEHAAAVDPHNSDALHFAAALFPPQQALDILAPHLRARPVLVDAHRAYQTVMEREHPDHDLVGEYRKHLAAEPNDPGLAYLLGRVVTSGDERGELYQKAANGANPCPRAFGAIAFRCYYRAQFEDGLDAVRKGLGHLPNDMSMRSLEYDMLLALGRYDEILNRPELAAGLDAMPPRDATSKALILAAAAPDGVANWITRYEMGMRRTWGVPDGAIWRECTEALAAYVNNDPAPLARLSTRPAPLDPDVLLSLELGAIVFSSHMVSGDLAAAAKDVEGPPSINGAESHLMLYIAAALAGENDLAAAQRSLAVQCLALGDRDDKRISHWLDGNTTPVAADLTELAIDTSWMPLVLTAIGIHCPAVREPAFSRAAKLNFDKQFPHHLVAKALKKTDWPGAK